MLGAFQQPQVVLADTQ
ncbi:hypothetical protein ABVN80_21290 [Acinetobacter baumannii]